MDLIQSSALLSLKKNQTNSIRFWFNQARLLEIPEVTLASEAVVSVSDIEEDGGRLIDELLSSKPVDIEAVGSTVFSLTPDDSDTVEAAVERSEDAAVEDSKVEVAVASVVETEKLESGGRGDVDTSSCLSEAETDENEPSEEGGGGLVTDKIKS